MDKHYRGLLVEYDNIIQSMDYGHIDYMLHNIDWNENKLKYEQLFRKMTPEETVVFLNGRNIKDLSLFLSKDGVKRLHLDDKHYSEQYYRDIQLSKFAESLPVLLSSNSVNKLFIAVDKQNKFKLNVVLYLLKEYKKEVVIIDTNDISKYLEDDRINSVFLNDETAFRNIDKLHSKAVMINNVGYIFDFVNVDGQTVKITKNRWEEKSPMIDISLIEPFRYPIKRFVDISDNHKKSYR